MLTEERFSQSQTLISCLEQRQQEEVQYHYSLLHVLINDGGDEIQCRNDL